MNMLRLSEQMRRLGRASLRLLPILAGLVVLALIAPRLWSAGHWLSRGLDIGTLALMQQQSGQPCGNPVTGDGDGCDDDKKCTEDGEGTGGSESDCNQGGANWFSPYTGNAHRTITDLRVHGAVGQFGLSFRRYSSTRFNSMTANQGWFGRECGFAHNWQYYMRDIAPTAEGRARVKVAFPDSRDIEFVEQDDGATWVPPAPIGMRLFEAGNDLMLQDRAGIRYHFKRRTNASGATYYRVESIQDPEDNAWTLTYFGESNRLKRVTEPAGRWIELVYLNDAFVKQQEVVLASSPMDAPKGQWLEVPVSDTRAYRFLAMHFINDWRNAPSLPVSEIEFYDAAGLRITNGTPIGSEPVYAPGQEAPMASDGNTNTFYRYAHMRNGYVGIDMGAGNSNQVSRIRYFIPDLPEITPVAKAEFVGLNALNQSQQVITQVKSSDGRTINYSYDTFTDPSGLFDWVHLTGATYPDGAQAMYGYVQVHDYTQPLLEFSRDPRIEGIGTIIQYVYDPSTALGFLRKELSGVTLEVIAETAHDSAHVPKVVYPNGRVVKNKFSGNSDPIEVTDGRGNKTSYTYDQGGAGFRASKTDPLGRTTTFERNEYGAILRQTGPDGLVTEYVRDERNRVLTETVSGPGVAPRTTTYTRDAQGRVIRKDYPDASFEEWTYNGFGEQLTHTDRNGNAESWAYDARGLMTGHTDAAGHTRSYAYDALDRVASVTDPLGRATAMAYNDRGQITQTTHADGTSAATAFDEFGNRIAVTNELGHAWGWVFDEFRQPVSASDPIGRTTTYVYGTPAGGGGGCGGCSASGKPTRITLPSGKTTVYGYDVDWNLVSVTAAYGTSEAATHSVVVDAVNNIVAATDPLGNTTAFTYDPRNRVSSTTDPLNQTIQFTYDLFGNWTSEIRPDGGVTTNLFDINDRMVASTDPKGQLTEYEYDANGNVLAQIDPRGNAYAWTHDPLDRKTRMTYPGGSFEAWEYDPAGNAIRYTTRAGQIMTATFDLRNREVASDWSDATPDITRAFDAAGRLTLLDNGNARLTYAYDAANQLLGETTRLAGSAIDRTVAYTYDADGNRDSVTYPGGRTVAYSYTARNQVEAIASDGSTLAAYAYDLAGRRLIKALENGTRAVYAYDDKGQMLTVDHQTGMASWLRFDYAYDAVGNRTHKATTDVLATRYEIYGHDPVDQLISVQYNALDLIGTAADRSVEYVHDAAGNRGLVTDNGAPAVYSANNLNQYTQVHGITPAHDANGNMTRLGAWTYAYDAQNRLVSATDGASTASFAYDGRNRKVTHTIDGAATLFIWDDWSLIEERNNLGDLVSDCVHGPIIDEVLSKTDDGGTVYYHHDGLGSTIALTDPTGTLVEKYRYDVYGAPEIFDPSGNPIPNSTFENRFLFTGREWLSSLALYDYRHRMYHPALGRYLQVDPIGLRTGSANLYWQTDNAPTDLIDPFGLESCSKDQVGTMRETDTGTQQTAAGAPAPDPAALPMTTPNSKLKQWVTMFKLSFVGWAQMAWSPGYGYNLWVILHFDCCECVDEEKAKYEWVPQDPLMEQVRDDGGDGDFSVRKPPQHARDSVKEAWRSVREGAEGVCARK